MKYWYIYAFFLIWGNWGSKSSFCWCISLWASPYQAMHQHRTCRGLPQSPVNSLLLLLGTDQIEVHCVLYWWCLNMKFVLRKLLFWLPLICQVADWEQVRQFPSAEETHKSLCVLRIAELDKPNLHPLQLLSVHWGLGCIHGSEQSV